MSHNNMPIEKLKSVMESLRDPETGCPWDIAQDFQSIVPYTIEEAYEVADAIETHDFDSLKDELGDLLFQVIYHAQMASEQNLFEFNDIVEHVTNKMISRHPHVFENEDAADINAVNEIWEVQKNKEVTGGALDNVTKGLPALLRAQKLQKKAARTGFEWPSSIQAFEKLEEEIAEFKQAKIPEHKEEELGDLLFSLVNYARMEGLNPEEALRKTNNKFISRFQGMEQDAKASIQNFNDLSLDEMLKSWNKQKK